MLLAWFFSKMLAVPHAHQAKILRHPHNENFAFLQLFMRIRLIFFVSGNNQFLKLMVMWQHPLNSFEELYSKKYIYILLVMIS
ncbi:hypothetical protein COE15_08720 [Bacillus cereus]|nr:hypothetical protein CN288_23070 [Bacillus sp. AFS023182]PGY02515.1 hypothetical protein COE15_08720 [Bacillus cereus]